MSVYGDLDHTLHVGWGVRPHFKGRICYLCFAGEETEARGHRARAWQSRALTPQGERVLQTGKGVIIGVFSRLDANCTCACVLSRPYTLHPKLIPLGALPHLNFSRSCPLT